MSESGQAVPQRRFGPILLAPGYTPKQVIVFLFTMFACTFVTKFAYVMQPLVLTQQLHVPVAEQGRLTGLLGTIQQWGTFLFIIFAGSMSDIVGRRALITFALLGFWVCLLTYPFMSVVWALFVLRFVWGVSFTGFTAGGATMAMDLPDNRSRGKLVCLALVAPELLASFFLWQTKGLPRFLQDRGYGPHGVSLGSFGVISLFALAGAAAAYFLLARDGRKARALPQGEAAGQTAGEGGVRELFANVAEVFRHARRNNRFALIMLIGTVVRTDNVIINTFIALWVVTAGRHGGIDAAEATKTAGLLASIFSFSFPAGLMVFGVVADRVNRVRMVMAALMMTAAAFASFGLVDDVFGWGMIAAMAAVGITEGAQSTAAQSLIAQEAPPHLRGSAMGTFAFLGTASLMGVNLLGGYLFDAMGYASPMIMEGVLHLLAFIAALALLNHQKRRARAAAELSARAV